MTEENAPGAAAAANRTFGESTGGMWSADIKDPPERTVEEAGVTAFDHAKASKYVPFTPAVDQQAQAEVQQTISQQAIEELTEKWRLATYLAIGVILHKLGRTNVTITQAELQKFAREGETIMTPVENGGISYRINTRKGKKK